MLGVWELIYLYNYVGNFFLNVFLMRLIIKIIMLNIYWYFIYGFNVILIYLL